MSSEKIQQAYNQILPNQNIFVVSGFSIWKVTCALTMIQISNSIWEN